MPTGMYKDKATDILSAFAAYEREHGTLPGIRLPIRRETLVKQIISSMRRTAYVQVIRDRNISGQRQNPFHASFDPIKGAALLMRRGNLDEAVWLTFIATHFGKHKIDSWKLAANVFGSFGHGPIWTAESYGRSPDQFLAMLVAHRNALSDMRESGRYSNHRQYQSKAPEAINRIFRTFFDWQFRYGGVSQRVRQAHLEHGQNPTEVFDVLYRSLTDVSGFGRLGKFDFLTMLSKLHLAPIEAGSTYLVGATGPLSGSKLLFFDNREYDISTRELQTNVDALDTHLKVGKQVIEDSLCNWQKSPIEYEYFRG